MGVNVCHVFAEAQGRQQRVSDYLELELQAIVGHHVGAGNNKNSKNSPHPFNDKKNILKWFAKHGDKYL